jgi:hypothetical protein
MSDIFFSEDITQEEQDKVIEQVAEKIHEYKMETIAILSLESVKPLAYIGGEMSRVFISPFLPALGTELNVMGEKYITIFENRENIEKLIQLLEKKSKETKSKIKEKNEQKAKRNSKKSEEKKGWLKWLPF